MECPKLILPSPPIDSAPAAVACLWAVLHHAAAPDTALRLNQCLRLMSQHGAAARLVGVGGSGFSCPGFLLLGPQLF